VCWSPCLGAGTAKFALTGGEPDGTLITAAGFAEVF